MRVDGAFHTLDALPELDKNKKHSIDLVVDRLVNKEGIRGRLADSVELALRFGDGRLVVTRPTCPRGNRTRCSPPLRSARTATFPSRP